LRREAFRSEVPIGARLTGKDGHVFAAEAQATGFPALLMIVGVVGLLVSAGMAIAQSTNCSRVSKPTCCAC
jgi:hypothetical protein